MKPRKNRLVGPCISSAPEPSKRSALLLQLMLMGAFLALGFCSRARTNSNLAWTFVGTAAFLSGWQWILFQRSGRNASRLAWEFVAARAHYVQASVQFVLYIYWAHYWPNVYEQVPLILAQVAFLYLFDGLLCWSRGLTWRLGFGPWPIILGSNLFIWFKDDWFVVQFLMVALGVLGKHFIRWRRDGKLTHVFNPSAFALTVMSFILIFTGTTDHTWGVAIATTQDWPPHLYIVIFLGGLVVQYLFSVTLMTFSAVLALCLVNLVFFHATNVYFFFSSNISVPVFLSLHLLMTDPATTPRSSVGKIVFGALFGLGVALTYWILEAYDVPNFYQKLLIVPFLNLLTPFLDRMAGTSLLSKFGRSENRIGLRKMNLAYMSCWSALFLVMLRNGYVEAPHPGDTLQFWITATEENRPTASRRLTKIFDYLYKLDPRGNPNGTLVPPNRNAAIGASCNTAGRIYLEGKLVQQDIRKACHFFAQASDFGNADGCANLAIQHVIFGRPEAESAGALALAKLETAAAEMTDGQLLYLIGYSYDIGRGHPVDRAKARQFYERSAIYGYFEARQKLAHM